MAPSETLRACPGVIFFAPSDVRTFAWRPEHSFVVFSVGNKPWRAPDPPEAGDFEMTVHGVATEDYPLVMMLVPNEHLEVFLAMKPAVILDMMESIFDTIGQAAPASPTLQ